MPPLHLFARRINPGSPGPMVHPYGGDVFRQPVSPYRRTALYASETATVCCGWVDGFINRNRQTYVLDGITYQLHHI